MRLRALATAAAIALTALPAYAHFGVLMPGSELVNRPKTPLELTLAFCHPVEQNGMNLAKPEAFDVWQNGKKTSLLNTLKETQVLKHEAWKSTFTVTRPGTYSFAFTPKPYWEPAEDKFIVHYTKVVVGAMGDEEGSGSRLKSCRSPAPSRTGPEPSSGAVFSLTGSPLLKGRRSRSSSGTAQKRSSRTII